MKKWLLRTVILLAAVAVIAYVGCEFVLGSIVVAGVNRFGPIIVHTRVVMTGAHISPFTGSGTLTGLVVGNPKGWSSDKAFSMETIHVQVVPSSFFGDHIIVKEIVIDKPEFVYETRFLASNIGELLKNIDSSTTDGTGGQATTKSGKPIKFEVRHFRLEGGHVTIGVGPAAITLPMATIDLKDLGTSEGGITSDQLALAVMRSVTSSIVSTTAQAAAKIGSTMGADAGQGLRDLFGGKH